MSNRTEYEWLPLYNRPHAYSESQVSKICISVTECCTHQHDDLDYRGLWLYWSHSRC